MHLMSDTGAANDDPAAFHERLDAVEEKLDDAETEADLDDIEATLDVVEDDLDEAELPTPPEPDDEDEETPPDPREKIEERVGDLRDGIESQRGPYSSEVTDAIDQAISTIDTTEWAAEGHEELQEVIDTFANAVTAGIEPDVATTTDSTIDAMSDVLADAKDQVEAAELHPDVDTPVIESLLDATTALTDGINAATAFGDLPVREQLNRKGFFDSLGHYKDFPVEWSALKAHEEERNVDMILLAFDLLDSNFLEEHCIDALRRLGDPAALDAMMALAQRRDKDAIEVLGKIGASDPVETLVEYATTESDPHLQRVSLKALGEIGDANATETVAQQLVAGDPEVRSMAARALGMIGDPRAIDPLADALETDEAEPVRGSAAWALVQIGTQEALDMVLEYREDTSFLVEQEAAKVTA